MSIWTGTAEAAKVSTAGNFGFGVSSPDASARIQSANGIKLGNTANANPVVFDFYEEGTFTPSSEGGNVVGVATYTRRVGRFTRRGNRVEGQMTLGWSAHTGSGAIALTGLPYLPISVANSLSPVAIRRDGIPIGAGFQIQGYVATGSTYIEIDRVDAATGAKSACSLPSAVDMVSVYFSYEV
jgi:hypothetical protein